MSAPVLSKAVFDQLAKAVYEVSGIHLTERQRPQVEARATQRVRALGLDSLEEYERQLSTQGAGSEEMERLLDLLAVHESYFFRETSQLSLVARTLVPEMRQRRGVEPVRVWSAGCAAGEEPYSLAMMLEETGAWDQGPIEILGTDLSTTCLERARQAVYANTALRRTSRARRERFFEPSDGGVRVREAVRRRVHLQRLNLYRDLPHGCMGHFDIILCRNVLLYFDVPARQQVVEALHDRLRRSGVLLLGCTETLLNVPNRLEASELRGEIIYRPKIGADA